MKFIETKTASPDAKKKTAALHKTNPTSHPPNNNGGGRQWIRSFWGYWAYFQGEVLAASPCNGAPEPHTKAKGKHDEVDCVSPGHSKSHGRDPWGDYNIYVYMNGWFFEVHLLVKTALPLCLPLTDPNMLRTLPFSIVQVLQLQTRKATCSIQSIRDSAMLAHAKPANCPIWPREVR